MADLLSIPTGFNSWSRHDQVRHYLEAGLRLQPVYGPTAEGVDSPGKRPRLTLEQRLALTHEDVLNWFANGAPDNLGQVPSKPHIAIDLDDKSGGHALEFFLFSYPDLANAPRVKTNRGAHLHLICPDLPAAVKKCVVENLLPNLNVELFADPAGNVVLPPSVHPNGLVYEWIGEGAIPIIPWAKLCEIFKFRHQQGERPELSGKWKRAYRGDLRTLNMVALCEKVKIYGQLLDPDEGKHSVRCPWVGEHTGGAEHWKPSSSDSIIFSLPGKVPGFRCLHAHCSDRSIEHLLAWAETQDRGVVDQFCRKTYNQPGKAAGFFDDPIEEEVRCPYPLVNWNDVSKTTGSSGPEFVHPAIYPEDSLLREYMAAGRNITEGADSYILGAILPVVASMLKRRVHIAWGAGPLYPNMYSILVGRPGDRKSSTIQLAERIARRNLPLESFLPMNVSPESLFEQYYAESGGVPDKLWVCDDANIVVSDWISSSVGARTATRFLRLYDCKEFDEAFIRSKKGNEGKSGRCVEQTSTSILFGSTFTVCAFQGTPVQNGLSRRFLYYLADGHGRFIVRPLKYEIGPLADSFAPLLKLSGEVDFAPAAMPLWEEYQKDNRRKIAETNRFDDALGARLNSAPTHVLKIAMLFEAVRAAYHRWPGINDISAESLELAVQHVEENVRSSAFLERIAIRQATSEQAEILLATVRKEFRSWGDTIYATRTDLTREFCLHTSRRGALTVSELYDKILPHLQTQGECVRVLKKGKLEVFAFPMEKGDGQDEDPRQEGNSPTSPFSPGGHTQGTPLSDKGIGENGENKNDVCTREVSPEVSISGENGENREFAPEPTLNVKFKVITTPAEVDDVWYDLLERDEDLAIDFETYGERPSDALNPRRGEARLLTVSSQDGEALLFDLKALGYGSPDWITLFRNREIIGHNLRFDASWAREKLNVRLPKLFCTWSAAKILSNGNVEVSNALGPLVSRFLEVMLPKEQGTSDWGSMMLTEDQLQYAANDTAYLPSLRAKLLAELEPADLLETFHLEMALLPGVVDMQARGMPVDRERLAAVRDDAAALRKEQEAELKKYLGAWINFDSPDQLKDAFNAIGVALPNTNEETLADCSHEAAKLLLAYRSHEMVRRQAEALLSAVSAAGRIHAEFKPLGTETGRFSSANPNLQNIGRGELRKCFAPTDPSRVFVVADYSQIELRVAAWFSGDKAMKTAFAEGRDLHIETAAILLGKKPSEITKDDRQVAKAANFGLLYGQGVAGLVRYAKTNYGVNLTEAEATSIRKKFFAHYKGLASWHKAAFSKAKEVTEGRTIIGRRRLLSASTSEWDRFQVQVNYVVQGSCADGLKHALAKLASQLPLGAYVIGTVHDELIVECPRAAAANILALTGSILKDAFEALFKGLVVEVDAKVCDNWGEK